MIPSRKSSSTEGVHVPSYFRLSVDSYMNKVGVSTKESDYEHYNCMTEFCNIVKQQHHYHCGLTISIRANMRADAIHRHPSPLPTHPGLSAGWPLPFAAWLSASPAAQEASITGPGRPGVIAL